MDDSKSYEFLLWAAEQKKQVVEKLSEEQTRAFDRIRSRLTTFLPVLTTLSLGAIAGAVSKTLYAPICSFMALGFISSALCCVMGLRTNYGFTPSIPSLEMIEKITEDVKYFPCPQVEATRMIALYMDKNIEKRGAALWADRRWLQRAIWGMLITTVASLPLFFLLPEIQKFG